VSNNCTLYHGNPRQIGSRGADDARINNINVYTMSPNWKWTDGAMGPFVLATMAHSLQPSSSTATIERHRPLRSRTWGQDCGSRVSCCNSATSSLKVRTRTDIAAHFFAYWIAVIAIVLAAIIGTDK
jgi:hypothetical protein